MSPHIPISVVAFKTLTLLLGGLITYFSYRAYKRTGAPSLRALAVGFGVVTSGSLLGGMASLLIEDPLEVSLLIESGLTTIGFAIIVYSLYTQE